MRQENAFCYGQGEDNTHNHGWVGIPLVIFSTTYYNGISRNTQARRRRKQHFNADLASDPWQETRFPLSHVKFKANSRKSGSIIILLRHLVIQIDRLTKQVIISDQLHNKPTKSKSLFHGWSVYIFKQKTESHGVTNNIAVWVEGWVWEEREWEGKERKRWWWGVEGLHTKTSV